MNLLAAIVEHQDSLLRLYRKLEERFEENSVIRALWSAMAGDVSLQIQSLKSLPSSLWNQFKNAPDDDFVSAVKSVHSPPADVTDISLRDCFEISLQLAEPVVLKIYARVIRLLRKNSTAQSLDFYILVKAYAARLVRTTESFAGDPLLTRRARLLLSEMEKGVQEPSPEIRALASKALSAAVQKSSVSGKADAKTDKAAAKKPQKNTDASKTVLTKSKALPEKSPAANKRARR